MGIYTPRKCPPLLTAAWLNEELTAIETAHNSHSKENFPDNCVPLAAMQNRYGYFTEVLLPEDCDTSDATYYIVPVDCTLVKYTACAAACDGSSKFYLGYFPMDVTGISGSVVDIVTTTSFVSANNVLSGTLNVTLYPGYVIAVQTTTDGSLALKRSAYCLTFKAKHTS